LLPGLVEVDETRTCFKLGYLVLSKNL